MDALYVSLADGLPYYKDQISGLEIKAGQILPFDITMLNRNTERAILIEQLVFKNHNEYKVYAESTKIDYVSNNSLNNIIESITNISNGFGTFIPDTQGTLPTENGSTGISGLTPTGIIPGWYERVKVNEFGQVIEGEANEGYLIPSQFIIKQVMVGVVDGVNKTFTIPNALFETTEQIYRNGVLQNHYSIAGQTVIMDTAPALGSEMLVSYIKMM